MYMVDEEQQPVPEASTPPLSPQEGLDPEDITGLDENNLMAILAYLGVLVLIPLVMSRDNPYVSFHMKQGLVIFIGYIIAAIAVWWLPVVGNVLLGLLILISVVGVVQAAQGRRWKIPIITALANKFSI